MHKVGLALLVVVAAAAVSIAEAGCNNGSCTYVSKCANDGPVDPARRINDGTTCDNRKNDPVCGGYYNDYIACFQSNQACTSTGVTDYTITDGICGDTFAKWTNCYNGTDSGATHE
jgi:hypothetical protein